LIKFIDLFSGIGGFRLAFESLGAKCVFSSDIDKFARQTYRDNFGEEPQGDITKINAEDIPDFDILCAGFPCQPFSQAGKRKGFDDHRGNLFDEIIRIIKEKKPRVILLENVKGLEGHDRGRTLDIIIDKLVAEGYSTSYKILKACDYGLPTLRPRIYIVAFLSVYDFCKFDWPKPVPLRFTMSDVLKAPCEREVGLTLRKDGAGSSIDDRHNWQKYKIFTDVRGGANAVHSWDIIETTQRDKEICLAIMNNRRKSKYGNKDGNPLCFKDIQSILPNITHVEIDSLVRKSILIGKIIDKVIHYDFVNSKQLSGINGTYRLFSYESQIYSTLTASGMNDKIEVGTEIRTLTVDEMKMMMGFHDDFKFPVSKTQAMKQIGNSVAVDVIKAIGTQIIKALAS
jgi:DNA (cytosine-5)-methyltransferase 1